MINARFWRYICIIVLILSLFGFFWILHTQAGFPSHKTVYTVARFESNANDVRVEILNRYVKFSENTLLISVNGNISLIEEGKIRKEKEPNGETEIVCTIFPK